MMTFPIYGKTCSKTPSSFGWVKTYSDRHFSGITKTTKKNGFTRYQALTHSHITIMFETAELSLTSNMSSGCPRGLVESPKFHGLEPHFSIQLPITNFQTHVGNHGKLIHLHI